MSNPDERFDQIISVDIGGSHIVAAIVENNRILEKSRARVKVDPHASTETILNVWAGVIGAALEQVGATEKIISIAMPGPFDYANGISLIRGMNKYDSLYKVNVRVALAEKLDVPAANIYFNNDAQCFMLGEAVCGAVKDFDRAVGITIGTGLGSGISIDKKARDVNRAVTPFLNDIAESYLSTRWFVKRYLELSGKTVRDVKTLCGLKDEETTISLIFDEFAANLSSFLAYFIHDEKPEAVVIGGNIARASDRFLPAVISRLAIHHPHVSIQLTELWEDSALIGASCSVNNGGFTTITTNL